MVRKNIKLTTEFRGGANSTSFSGRKEGRDVRGKLHLDEKDRDNNEYEVMIPKGTTSFNPSYFLGLFYKSIKVLGMDAFLKKYEFSYTELDEPLRPIIESNIKLGIVRAGNELTGKTGLDSFL